MAGGTRFRRVAIPLKELLQRFAFALLIGATFALMIFGQVKESWVEALRAAVVDVISPVQDALSRPAAAAAAVADHVRGLVQLHEENRRLRQENERLLAWQAVARRLEAENQALRSLANAAPEDRASFVSARVIGDTGGAFVRSLLVNAGARDGVAKGQAAVDRHGLIGRVIEVGQRSARVLLITDLNSRIPVALESSREHAILGGDNSERLRLFYLPANVVPAPDERVVTSGQGGLIPPGIPVGRIVGRTLGAPVVAPYAVWNRLEYVSLINHARPAPPGEPW